MKVLIVAPFCSLPGEPYFNRFLYLAKLLSTSHEVTLLTSRFRHFDKTMRKDVDKAFGADVILIDEPGYQSNVSFARLLSHRTFCRNFRNWLSEVAVDIRYDLVYSAYPLISTNLILGSAKYRMGFKLIVDVQDIWPEAISSALPLVGGIPSGVFPFSRRADAAYRAADALVAVSDTYLERAKRVNPLVPSLTTYIGSDLELLTSVPREDLPGSHPHFMYLGTLSHSYDIETVLKGFEVFRQQHSEACLHILGDGPDRARLERMAGRHVYFYGLVPYVRMVALAKGADYFINPIKSAAKNSVTNKLADYILLGKPIVSSQTNPEVCSLLERVGGIQYESGNVASFSNAVARMVNHESESYDRGDIERLFDRRLSYKALVRFIERIFNNQIG